MREVPENVKIKMTAQRLVELIADAILEAKIIANEREVNEYDLAVSVVSDLMLDGGAKYLPVTFYSEEKE